MLDKTAYAPLDTGSLPRRLGEDATLVARLGPAAAWKVTEVGDGNLNLVFIVEGPEGSAVAKQALPYARCVGESWPMSLDRAFYEHNALTRLGPRDPGRMPDVYAYDERQALIVMEHLSPHEILRKSFVGGRVLPELAGHIGRYLARTAFRGSDLSMPTARRKADAALFAGNVELCGITEDLVFTDPYTTSDRNRVTPGLEADAAAIRNDGELKLATAALKARFATCAETLLHGDFHAGSVMVSDTDVRVIDPEFAFYGPIGFDLGSFIGNLYLAFFAQPGHRTLSELTPYQDWILSVAEGVWTSFAEEFGHLWRTEREGMLGLRDLFENAGDEKASDLLLDQWLSSVWRDALGFAGAEMHRRMLGLAHVEELEAISDPGMRAECERRALELARLLMLGRDALKHPADISRFCLSIGGR
jgi:5-methylthioribose kinase